MLLLHIMSFIQRDGKFFPTIAELHERTAIPEEQLVKHLQYLVSEKYVDIIVETDDDGFRSERYDLEPLYEKLADCYVREAERQREEEEKKRESGFLTKFEQEFGRPLSPMECELLAKWIDEDKNTEELILAALKEAVFADKLNFRYIDRILLEWQRNRIKTAEQAKQFARNFRHKGTIYRDAKPHQPTDDFPFYNWVKR